MWHAGTSCSVNRKWYNVPDIISCECQVVVRVACAARVPSVLRFREWVYQGNRKQETTEDISERFYALRSF